MKRTFTLSLLVFLFSFVSQAQTPNTDYFEVFTKPAYTSGHSRGFSLNRDTLLSRIANVPDTATSVATFVFTVGSANTVDSVFLTLTNSNSQTVYTSSADYNNLSSSNVFRRTGNTIYINAGSYPYLKRFTATARLKYADGSWSTIRSFSKN